MKKITLLLLTMICTIASCNFNLFAQIRNETPKALDLYLGKGSPAEGIIPDMRYRELKRIYDYRDYTPALADRYNPTLNGFASFMIPGLGQMICRQNNRGIAHLSVAVLLCVISGTGINMSYIWSAPEFLLLTLGSGVILFGWQIYSGIDARRVSKIMNMYERDLQKKNIIKFNLHPSVGVMNNAMGSQAVAGLGLSMTF